MHNFYRNYYCTRTLFEGEAIPSAGDLYAWAKEHYEEDCYFEQFYSGRKSALNDLENHDFSIAEYGRGALTDVEYGVSVRIGYIRFGVPEKVSIISVNTSALDPCGKVRIDFGVSKIAVLPVDLATKK